MTDANGKIPPSLPIRPKSVVVPLTIWVGSERRLAGTAMITGDEVVAYLDEERGGRELAYFVEQGLLGKVTLRFELKPVQRQVVTRSEDLVMFHYQPQERGEERNEH